MDSRKRTFKEIAEGPRYLERTYMQNFWLYYVTIRVKKETAESGEISADVSINIQTRSQYLKPLFAITDVKYERGRIKDFVIRKNREPYPNIWMLENENDENAVCTGKDLASVLESLHNIDSILREIEAFVNYKLKDEFYMMYDSNGEVIQFVKLVEKKEITNER